MNKMKKLILILLMFIGTVLSNALHAPYTPYCQFWFNGNMNDEYHNVMTAVKALGYDIYGSYAFSLCPAGPFVTDSASKLLLGVDLTAVTKNTAHYTVSYLVNTNFQSATPQTIWQDTMNSVSGLNQSNNLIFPSSGHYYFLFTMSNASQSVSGTYGVNIDALTNNQWHSFAVSYNGSAPANQKAIIAIDGVTQTVIVNSEFPTLTSALAGVGPVFIGGDYAQTKQIQGALSQFTAWTQSMTQAQLDTVSRYALKTQYPITLKVVPDTLVPGDSIRHYFLGLGHDHMDTTQIVNHNPATNSQYAMLLNQLGPGVLRLGGWDADICPYDSVLTPSFYGGKYLHGIKSWMNGVNDWKVLYGINMGFPNMSMAKSEIKYLRDSLPTKTYGVEFGNEPESWGTLFKFRGSNWYNTIPNGYCTDSAYNWKKMSDTALALWPSIPLTGPAGAGTRFNDFDSMFVHDFKDRIIAVTSHVYHGNDTNNECYVSYLLSRGWHDTIGMAIDTNNSIFSRNSSSAYFRFSECNSAFNGSRGLPDTAGPWTWPNDCRTYGSSLWTFDFLFNAAKHKAGGINIHGSWCEAWFSDTPAQNNINKMVLKVQPGPITVHSDGTTEITYQYPAMLAWRLACPTGSAFIKSIVSDTVSNNWYAYTLRNATGDTLSFAFMNGDTVNTHTYNATGIYGFNQLASVYHYRGALHDSSVFSVGKNKPTVSAPWVASPDSFIAQTNSIYSIPVPPGSAMIVKMAKAASAQGYDSIVQVPYIPYCRFRFNNNLTDIYGNVTTAVKVFGLYGSGADCPTGTFISDSMGRFLLGMDFSSVTKNTSHYTVAYLINTNLQSNIQQQIWADTTGSFSGLNRSTNFIEQSGGRQVFIFLISNASTTGIYGVYIDTLAKYGNYQWHSIVCSYNGAAGNGSKALIAIDGVTQPTIVVSEMPTSTGNVAGVGLSWLGGDLAQTSPVQGSIADFTMWTQTMTQQQIDTISKYELSDPFFATTQFTMTMANDGHGTNTPATGAVDSNSSNTITNTANAGYRFQKWTRTASSPVSPFGDSTANPTTITVKGAVTVTSYDTIIHYQLTNANDGYGTFTPASGLQDTAASFAISAAAAPGYRFWKWTRSGVSAVITDSSTASTTAYLKAACTITLNDSIIHYQFTNANDGHGTFTPASGLHDTAVTFSLAATAAPGYRFKNWTRSNASVIISDSTSPTSNVYLKAAGTITQNDTIIHYTLTVSTTGTGTTTPSTGLVDSGATTAINNTPGIGYAFKTWTVSGGVTLTGTATTASNGVKLTSAGTVTAVDTASASGGGGNTDTIIGVLLGVGLIGIGIGYKSFSRKKY